MKKIIFLLAIAGLAWLPVAASAQTAGAKPADPNPSAKKLCETVSMITGVAISPMLGVSAVGAYDYYQAKTPEQKAALPWFANPLFFVPAMLLVGACFLKDSAGVVLPTAVGRVVLVDVWKQETIYRVLTFMALGIALLVVGFVYNKYQETIRKWL